MSAEIMPAETPLEIAAVWFARKRSGQMSAHELRELQAWLDQDLENLAAYREVARAWEMVEAVRTDPEILAVREAARVQRPFRGRMLVFGAMAASFVVALVRGWTALSTDLLDDLISPPAPEKHFHTAVGQTSTVALADGSLITLDTDTVLRTRETRKQRLIYLDRGQALFHVAKNPSRPFIVSAGGKTVTALGTVFDVRLDKKRFQVTLLEGKVRVASPRTATQPGQWAEMVAGWQLVSRNGTDWSLNPVNSKRQAKETGWTEGQLTFAAEPLGNIAAEMNRYSKKKIVIADAHIAQTPIDGVFRTGDIDGFVKLVTTYNLARVTSDTGSSVVLDAPEKSTSEKDL